MATLDILPLAPLDPEILPRVLEDVRQDRHVIPRDEGHLSLLGLTRPLKDGEATNKTLSYAYVHGCMCFHIDIDTCMYIYIHTCTYVYSYLHVYIYMYVQVHTRINLYIHTRTCIYSSYVHNVERGRVRHLNIVGYLLSKTPPRCQARPTPQQGSPSLGITAPPQTHQQQPGLL